MHVLRICHLHRPKAGDAVRIRAASRDELQSSTGGLDRELSTSVVALLQEYRRKACGDLRKHSLSFEVSEGAEVTLEANPEDVSAETLGMWTDMLGVNRLSLGVQSFHEQELVPLGRGHGRAGALGAIALAASNVPRLSVDLILGLPGQTRESVAESAELATSGPVGHLSLYLLDLEPGSALEQRVRAGLVELPSEEETAEMYRTVIRIAEQRGFHQYEVSNFARPGEESIHNRHYWSRRSYVGVGLGAHSFDGRVRSANTRVIRDYIETADSGALPETFRERLGDEEVRHERLFLGLRQSRGLALDELHELAGEGVEEWLEEWLEQGWLISEAGWVRFSVEGFLISDELLAELF